MKAVGERVLIKIDEVETKTESGIIVPNGVNTVTPGKENMLGTVISVGKRALDIEVGDRVAVPDFAGAFINVNGEEVYSVNYKAIDIVIG